MSIAITKDSNIDQRREFATPNDEIIYWRDKFNELQSEFNEFQESSRELEIEYETQIKQLETKGREYEKKCLKLESENDQLRNKYSVYVNDTQLKLKEYQEQISTLTASNTQLTNYIRKLEQSNDDLERAQRALSASLADSESRLNQQIEKNVLLENELSEKEHLECMVQRLKEEARDLRHELIAKTGITGTADKVNGSRASSSDAKGPSHPIAAKNLTDTDNGSSTSNGTSSLAKEDAESGSRFRAIENNYSSQITPVKDHDSKSQQTSAPSSPTGLPSAMVISPTSRMSALRIVSDLLRKVVSLESKLAPAKNVAS